MTDGGPYRGTALDGPVTLLGAIGGSLGLLHDPGERTHAGNLDPSAPRREQLDALPRRGLLLEHGEFDPDARFGVRVHRGSCEDAALRGARRELIAESILRVSSGTLALDTLDSPEGVDGGSHSDVHDLAPLAKIAWPDENGPPYDRDEHAVYAVPNGTYRCIAYKLGWDREAEDRWTDETDRRHPSGARAVKHRGWIVSSSILATVGVFGATCSAAVQDPRVALVVFVVSAIALAAARWIFIRLGQRHDVRARDHAYEMRARELPHVLVVLEPAEPGAVASLAYVALGSEDPEAAG